MHSFDLFHTLVASRSGLNAGEVPVKQHIPIAENVARVSPDDVIVSDYYDSEKAQHIVTDVCGLSNKLICTPDGKATGKVWHEVQSESHIGDNVYCDYDSPRRQGIRSEVTTLFQVTARERACGQLGWVMREARLKTWHSDEVIRALQLFQIERNFPFLMKAAELINEKVQREGYTRLLLCSRDCFLLYQLMRRICAGYEVEYFYSSRITRYRPSESYSAYASERLAGKTLVVDMVGSGNSLKYLTDRFGGQPLLIVSSSNLVPRLMLGGLRETANQAPHPMIADVNPGEDGEWKPVAVNPTKQNWTKARIIEPQRALGVAIDCLQFHKIDSLSYSLLDAHRQMEHESLSPLWADHLKDSQATYDLLNSGKLPHPVIL